MGYEHIDNIVNQIVDLETRLGLLKKEERAHTLIQVKKAIAAFEFTSEEIFNPLFTSEFRNGSVDILRALFLEDINVSRKAYLAKAEAKGINTNTASTQLGDNRKKYTTAFHMVDDAYGYSGNERIRVYGKVEKPGIAELVLIESRLPEHADRRYVIVYNALDQMLMEADSFYSDLDDAIGKFKLIAAESMQSWREKARN